MKSAVLKKKGEKIDKTGFRKDKTLILEENLETNSKRESFPFEIQMIWME